MPYADSRLPSDRTHAHRLMPGSRREFLCRAGAGFGGLALAWLLARDAAAAPRTSSSPLAPKMPHFDPGSKRAIFLFIDGGPSHIDLFDPKPEVNKFAGQPLPASIKPAFTPMGVSANPILGCKRTFTHHGQSGIEVSDWLPHIAECVDDMAVIRSCWANGLNHVGSVCQMNTGSVLAGRPSLGSWVTYGLGTENDSLPAFVVLLDNDQEPPGGARNWGTGFMPATYQGTKFLPGNSPVLNLTPPPQIGAVQQRRKLDLLAKLNQEHAAARSGQSELEARIANYELAFRMQAAAPAAVDLAEETDETHRLYGLDDKTAEAFGRQCLLARRLVERGVRFVQLYCGAGSKWDAHSGLEKNHSGLCLASDKPIAGLLKDLKRRGLLDDTLVVWGGEFGRTPMSEKGDGRDHNPYGFTMWMAGGGVKAGQVVGATDDFGLYAIEDRAHVHDLHATILHLLGLDHEELTIYHHGLDERLTMNEGHVVRKLLA